MVFGYPGRTTRFLTAEGVQLITGQRNPDRIAIRDKKLEILNRYMSADPKVRIQYAAKHAGISNAWKKWQGEVMGLEGFEAVEKRRPRRRSLRPGPGKITSGIITSKPSSATRGNSMVLMPL